MHLQITFIFTIICCLNSFSQNTIKKIKLINADILEYDSYHTIPAKRLIGNVIFEHDSIFMYCDSAYFFSNDNKLISYGNIHLKKGDSLHLYGDSLQYDGNIKIAKIFGNILLENQNITLKTNYLVFDGIKNIFYYNKKGKIINKSESYTLMSKKGYYLNNSNSLSFKDSVVMINDDYKIFCDTLLFYPENKIAYFFGPTNIIGNNFRIYCEKGWYDTKNDIAQLNKNAIINKENKIIKGDSIYYERKPGFALGYGNISINDTLKKIIIKAQIAYLYEKKDSILITKKVLFEKIIDNDTLYLNSDTLIAKNDSISDKGNILAYHNVRFFKKNLQGICDSLIYSETDSSLEMFKNPILWSNENQMSADSIKIIIYDNEIKYLYMNKNAIIASLVDSTKFNQIKGNKIKALFINSELKKIFINQNAESIYYVLDNEKKIIGVNVAKCSKIKIKIDSNKINTITLYDKPEAIMYPLKEISEEEEKLKNFVWYKGIRPKSKFDIIDPGYSGLHKKR